MKETVGSLRLYFIIVGVVSGFLNSTALILSSSILGALLSLLGCALSIGFLYAGIKMPVLLATQPMRIRQLIFANIGVITVVAVINVLSGYIQGLASTGVGLAISAYLLSSVNRLAEQAAAEAEMVPAPVDAS